MASDITDLSARDVASLNGLLVVAKHETRGTVSMPATKELLAALPFLLRFYVENRFAQRRDPLAFKDDARNEEPPPKSRFRYRDD